MSNSSPGALRTCKNCHKPFAISGRDVAFYQKLEVPPPTWCPSCRAIRRHGHVNDYVYYTRNCDHCQTRFVATLPTDSGYAVICQRCWFSEARDDKAEGREYDPSRSFFEQFDELMHAAPQLGNIAINVENSEYCESIADCKNCYLISECSHCEDCFYGYWIQKTKDSVDTCYLHECERCYEVTDSFNCYGLKYSSNCRSCSDSFFLDNCVNCQNCAFSVNLRQKQYYLFNQAHSRDEYLAALAKYDLATVTGIEQLRVKFAEFLHNQPRRQLQLELAENSLGDYVRNAKNCDQVFHCYDAEDCSYGEHVWRGAKDCMDVQTAGRDAELIYESTNTNMGAYFSKFCRYCWGCRFTEYSNMCVNSSYLFGCVGMKAHSQYCILNRQYSKDDYFNLVEKIKSKMLADGEYGEFFPLSISLFGYNSSVSYDDREYSRAEVIERGWKWESTPSGSFGKETMAVTALPQKISETEDTILSEVLSCKLCERNYRITTAELKFYRAEQIPVPHCCPDCRHRTRLRSRNRKELIPTTCKGCHDQILTTSSPSTYTNILCHSCYLRVVE